MKSDAMDRHRRPERQHIGDRFDEADWLDWDHWQAMEEFQDLVDGLSASAANQDRDATQPPDEGTWATHFSRQLRRQGLEVDG